MAGATDGSAAADRPGDLAAGASPGEFDEEFVGPFPSWKSVRDYGAKGDGTSDDTAAIQAGLDALKNAATADHLVLYLPAGTYRITKTLVTKRVDHNDYLGISIIGEDPATTLLVWDGAAGQTMLQLDAWYAKVSRITFDGKSKAGLGLYRGDTFSTACELSDLWFQDMAIGVQMGGPTDGQAEHAVLRNHFTRISKYGLVTSNFNSLDIWVFWSRFEDCGYGLYNQAGGFQAYGNVFLRSKNADIGAANLMEFAFVNNVSVGSRAFTDWSSQQVWGAQILMQGNRIYDTIADHAITTGSGGPQLLIDNVIRNRVGYDGPAVQLAANDQLLVGNSFTSQTPVDTNNPRPGARLRIIGSRTLGRDQIPAPVTDVPPVPPNRHRKIFEVPAGATGDAIQAQIDAAAREPAGARPVVHLPPGNYLLAKALVVPSAAEIQLVGDGIGDFGTRLSGRAPGAPALHLLGPSRAVLRDLSVNGTGDGIVVDGADQSGGRVYGNQVTASGRGADAAMAVAAAVLVDGVEATDVTFTSLGFSGGTRSVVARGGPARKAGQSAPGQVSVFSGASSNTGILYDVEDGGELLAEAVWYEGHWPNPTHFDLHTSGALTVAVLQLAVDKDPLAPLVRVHQHQGDFTMLASTLSGGGTGLAHRIEIDGIGTGTKVLLAGDMFWVDQATAVDVSSVWKDTSGPAAQAALLLCNENGNIKPGGFAYLDGVSAQKRGNDVDDAAVLAGLRLLRSARLDPPGRRPAGVTDLKMFRIAVTGAPGATALTIRR